jgi:hypothetical protein
VNGHRSANRPRPRDVTSEPDEIRMRDNSAVDVDGEIVSCIASASLRHKDKVPEPIVREAGLCGGRKGDKTARGCRISKNRFHLFLQTVVIDLEASLSNRSLDTSRLSEVRDRMLVQSSFKSRRRSFASSISMRCVDCRVLVSSGFTIGHIGGIMAALPQRPDLRMVPCSL